MTTLSEALRADVLLTDSGLETDLVFHHGFDLPHFASFPLLEDADGLRALTAYYREHAEIAATAGTPFVAETPTWRASPDWGARLGYDLDRLAAVNRLAVQLCRDIPAGLPLPLPALVVSGCLGPRGDGYAPDELMTESEAQDYHAWQIGVFAEAGVDLVTAMTLTHAAEAIGIVRAATEADVPVVVAFTVETDGRLPDGSELGDAVTRTDAATAGAALHFMVNCAHPSHFEAALDPSAAWAQRVRAVRANASRLSHAELDEAEELDDGDPDELAQEYAALRRDRPWLAVLGGCCGTDARHVRAVAAACLPSRG